MTRLYIAGIVLAVLGGAGWYMVSLIQQNAELEIALEGAAQTITRQAQEAQRKEQINADLRRQREGLADETRKLRERLSGLSRTQAQRDCDVNALPADYPQWVREYADPQADQADTR